MLKQNPETLLLHIDRQYLKRQSQEANLQGK